MCMVYYKSRIGNARSPAIDTFPSTFDFDCTILSSSSSSLSVFAGMGCLNTLFIDTKIRFNLGKILFDIVWKIQLAFLLAFSHFYFPLPCFSFRWCFKKTSGWWMKCVKRFWGDENWKNVNVWMCFYFEYCLWHPLLNFLLFLSCVRAWDRQGREMLLMNWERRA